VSCGKDCDVRVTLDCSEMQFTDLFVGRDKEPRILVAELDDRRIFYALLSLCRVVFSRKTFFKLMHNVIGCTQSGSRFDIAEAVVKKKL
jgi:hypothetical protein